MPSFLVTNKTLAQYQYNYKKQKWQKKCCIKCNVGLCKLKSCIFLSSGGLTEQLLILVAMLIWSAAPVRIAGITRVHGVAHRAPTGQGIELIQKIAESILNCRENNCNILLNRYFYPPLMTGVLYIIPYVSVVKAQLCFVEQNIKKTLNKWLIVAWS